jgi:hypothetical protein
VRYIPDLLSLSEAREFLTASGLSASEAETDICRALREGKIRPTCAIERVTFRGPTVDPETFRRMDRTRFRLRVPADLASEDLDWENSRPRKPWPLSEGYFAHIARLALRRRHLEREFSVVEAKATNDAREEADAEMKRAEAERKRKHTVELAAREAPGQTSPPNVPGREKIARPGDDSAPMDLSDEPRRVDEPTGHKRRKKKGTKLERARGAIAELERVRGSLAELTDSELFSGVCKHLRIRETEISLETVRRAAGRRK